MNLWDRINQRAVRFSRDYKDQRGSISSIWAFYWVDDNGANGEVLLVKKDILEYPGTLERSRLICEALPGDQTLVYGDWQTVAARYHVSVDRARSMVKRWKAEVRRMEKL